MSRPRRKGAADTAIPYESLLRNSTAEAVVRDGWVLGDYPAVPLQPPVDWAFKGEASRSHNYHLHALDPIDPLLAADSAGRRSQGYLELAFAFAVDWARQHEDPADTGASPMAWYDMAVGLRAYRLAYVYDEARRRGLGTEAERDRLRRTLDAHREYLASDERFAAHSNHGLYQACGQLAMARRLSDLPGMPEAADQARRRLAAAIDYQFTREGVHREHSPGYHLRVLESLDGAESAGLLDTPELQAIVRRARVALSWFVKPDGRIVNFGDTDEVRVNLAITGGASPLGVKAFPESGYFVARTLGSYLAQTLAYHSRTHKHADDLSFVWCEQGRDILIDAGRYGYRGRTRTSDALWKRGFWYDDPNRVFVESTHAHNTVEVDGLSYDRRNEPPYGSALIAADHTPEGLAFSVGEVDHGPLGVHRRLLVLMRAKWLLVIDRLARPDGRQAGLLGPFAPPTRQWFHFAPDLEVSPASGGAVRIAQPDGGLKLTMQSLVGGVAASRVARGQLKPRMQGWTSPRGGVMLPASAVAMETSARPALFATLLHLGEAPVTRPRAEIADGGDRLELTWSAGDQPARVTVTDFLTNPRVTRAIGER